MAGWYIAIVLILLAIKLKVDKNLNDDPDKKVNHLLSASIDGSVYVIAGALMFGWDFWKWTLLALSIRWILFDLLFNYINGWPLFYYGNTSIIDRGMTKLGPFHFLPKLVLLTISIYLTWN